MTSKISFNPKGTEMKKLNPEKAWLMEMLRRFKLIPILLTIMYFFSNILPVLIFYGRFERIAYYVNISMNMGNVLNIFLAIGSGVVAASAVFGYLHKSASVTDAHSRPLTRKSLFKASFTAGLVMLFVPVIITGLFYLCVQGAHVSASIDKEAMMMYGMDFKVEELLSAKNVVGWVLANFIMVGFAYCVSCFAGMLAGTSLIQTLLSIFLMFLPTAIYSIFEGYLSVYVRGYSSGFDWARYLSPYIYMFSIGDYPLSSISAIPIIYIAFMVLLALVSLSIYKKIHLENEENSIVVPYASSVLVVILTFMSASTILLISDTIIESSGSVGISIVVIILATAICFPIFCMIADQSFRVFNSYNMKVLGIYAVLICLTLMFTMFDISGFEKKIPQASEIKTVNIQVTSGIENGYYGSEGGIIDIDNPKTIQKITKLHKAIVSAEPVDDNSYPAFFEVEYHLKNGRILKRTYNEVSEKALKEYAFLYNDSDIRSREQIDLSVLNKKSVSIEVISYAADEKGLTSYRVPKNLMKGLLQAVNKDIMNWTVENRHWFDTEESNAGEPTVDLRININEGLYNPEELYLYINITFNASDIHIAKFLEDHPEIFSKNNKTDFYE
ncbi:MAG: hypothetical protein GX083_03225 [Clostridiales bacterium]|nr:hypothetical protein [Clostridiales bacterium]